MTTTTILIITSRAEQTAAWKERERYVQEFCQLVAEKLDNARVLYTTYTDLEYTVLGGKTNIHDIRNDLDLAEVTFVHFKNWEYNIHEAPVVAAYLQANNIAFHNTEILLPWAPGKLAQMVSLAGVGLPVPDTFYAPKKRLLERFESSDLPETFSYPLIMKANDGSRGDDNYLIYDAQEAITILKAAEDRKEFVLQTFIPNDGDFRLLFVGLEEDPLVFHRKGGEGTHLNNTSKGGAGTRVDLRDIPAEYLEYAHRAAAQLHRQIGGVDMLIDKETGKPYILEVNGTPALATGYGVVDKVDRFVAFVKNQVKSRV